MDTEFSLDPPRRERASDLRRALRLAKNAYGTPYLDQLGEMLALGLARNGLDPAEYHLYGLADHVRRDRAVRRSFLGTAGARSLRQVLPMPSSDASGKLRFERLMRSHGLPTTHTLARYGGKGPPDGIRHLADAAALGRFLRESADRYLFGKPAWSAEGQGMVSIDGWEPATDRLATGAGTAVSTLTVLRLLEPFERDGYLLQGRLATHPELSPLLGGQLSTVRALVLDDGDGPRLQRAAWRVPARGNIADGFWRRGNLLAAVDPETGRIWRVVDDIHPRQCVVERHPDSGQPLHDRMLPEWTMLRATVLAAAELFPGSPLLAFDVALTEDGPVLTDMAGGTGDPVVLQLAHDSGLLDGALVCLVDSPWPVRRAA